MIEFKSEDDVQSILEPLLATLSANGYENIVEAFWATIEGSDNSSTGGGGDAVEGENFTEGEEAIGGTDGEDAGAME